MARNESLLLNSLSLSYRNPFYIKAYIATGKSAIEERSLRRVVVVSLESPRPEPKTGRISPPPLNTELFAITSYYYYHLPPPGVVVRLDFGGAHPVPCCRCVELLGFANGPTTIGSHETEIGQSEKNNPESRKRM